MKWTDALKEFAKKHGKFVVPKKGSPEYDEVRKLMDASATATAKAVEKVAEKELAPKAEKKAPRKPRAPRKKVDAPKDIELKEAKMEEKEKKPRRKAKLSAPQKDDGLAPPAPAMKPKRSRMNKKKALDKSAENPGGITMADVARSANPENVFSNAVNVHEKIAPPAVFAGELAPLKEAIAKVRKPRSLPKLVEAEKVDNEAPFSFQSFKRRIGA
jgi:hypothetical protein